jgi:hypothetical protein
MAMTGFSQIPRRKLVCRRVTQHLPGAHGGTPGAAAIGRGPIDFEIIASSEALAGAAKYDGSYRLVPLCLEDCLRQLLHHFEVDCVQRLGTVELNMGDAVLLLVNQCLPHGDDPPPVIAAPDINSGALWGQS